MIETIAADTIRSIGLLQTFPTDLHELWEQYGEVLLSAGATTALFLVVFIGVYVIARVVLVWLVRNALETRGFDETAVNLFARLTRITVFFAALGLAATIAGFGTVLAAFATLLGALALAVGFAAQDLLSNFVAGLFILRDKPFEVGDWIEWGDDNAGVVRDVRIRVTKIETFDNEKVTVPNTELANNAVTNPVTNDRLRISFVFGIGYDEDISRATQAIREEAETLPRVLSDPAPSVITTELGDSYIGLVGRIWIDDPDRGKYLTVQSNFITAVKQRFDADGIEIPYPYRELTGDVTIEQLQQEETVRP